ncbi:MAG TPA: flagellar basal-body rod protein FlgG [Opitutaceae bacterium]|nr:flagellar basal-body rod protein FlgG [Opitutaceae bacterium]
MNLSLYSSATGMEAQEMNLNTIANNLANVNTPGFKRSKIEFQDLLYTKPRAAGADSGNGGQIPTGIEVGNGAKVAATSKVFTQGQVSQTGQNLDLAIQGEGLFEVTQPDGTIAYTRDGSFKLNAQGQVVTADGLPVGSGFQTIQNGATNITISQTGMVTVQGPNGPQTFQLNLVRFPNAAGLESMGGNLYTETAASGAPQTGAAGQAGFGSILQGYLEGSNVNIVEEMVNLITAQRAYEVNSKSVQASDDMLQNAANMKR